MAETVACWKAIEAAVAHRIPIVQLETDSTILQRKVLTDEMDQAQAGVLFHDIRSLIWGNFLHFDCFHISRVCNLSAYQTASLVSNWIIGTSEVLEYPVPVFVQTLVAHTSVEPSIN